MCLQFPILAPLIPRQRKALAAVELIRETTTTLIRWAGFVGFEAVVQGSSVHWLAAVELI